MEKHFFSQKTLDFLKKAIGGIELLQNKSIITTTLVTSLAKDNLENLRVIKKEPGFPVCPEDWQLFMFLRAYCRSLLNTGQTLRAEREVENDSLPKFDGNKDIERYFYFGEDTSNDSDDIEKRPGKPILIMTRQTTAEDIKTIPFYRSLAYHHLVEKTPDIEKHMEDEDFKEFTRKYRISFVNDKIVDFVDALNYLREKNKFKSVLIEAGTALIGKYLEGDGVPSPFDLIILTVHSGKIAEKCIGNSYPPMSKLLVKHELVYTSPEYPCEDGTFTFYCLTKKGN